MNRSSFPAFIVDEDLLTASRQVLMVEVGALWSRWRKYALEHSGSSLTEALDRLTRNVPDTPKVRHWCAVTREFLKAHRDGTEPDPCYLSHFEMDGLERGRLTQLHTFKLLEAYAAARFVGDDPGDVLECAGEIRLPVSIDLGLGGLVAPTYQDRRGRWSLTLGAGEARFECGGAGRSTRSEPVEGRTVSLPSSWRWEGPAFMSHGGRRTHFPIRDRALCEPYAALAPIIVDQGVVEEWGRTLHEAFDYSLSLDPGRHATCMALLPEILPLYHGLGQAYASASNERVLGYGYLPGIRSPLDVAECFIHEAMHQKLFRLDQLIPLFESSSPRTESFYSPWRKEPRPLDMVLHGCYVFTSVAETWAEWMAHPPRDTTAQVAASVAYRRAAQVLDGLQTLSRHAEMTAPGNALRREIRERADALVQRVGVPPEFVTEVAEEIQLRRNVFGGS